MCLRVRVVMIWLLMACLPVQSWAAATMLNCGPVHGRMAVEAIETTGHAGHGHSLEAHASAGHEHGSPDADHQALELGQSNTCSACAACCLGLALPSTLLAFDASVSSDTFAPGMPHGRIVFLTAGLERPPRTILA